MPQTAEHQASQSLTISQSLPKLMSIELMMPSNHLILCHLLLLLPSVFPSIRVFSNESALLIRWSNYWSFSFSINPSSEYSGLITFRISLLSNRFSRVFSSTTIRKHQFFGTLPFYGPTLTSVHDYGKIHSLDYMDLCRHTDIFTFEYTAQACHSFTAKQQSSSSQYTSNPSASLNIRQLKHIEINPMCICVYGVCVCNYLFYIRSYTIDI